MTTIIYRDGVMVGDGGCWQGSTHIGNCVKIVRNRKGELFGAAGGAGYCTAFLDWGAGGCKGEPPIGKYEDGGCDAGIRVKAPGEITMYGDGEGNNSHSVKCDYFALGSGAELAMGAMAGGATAEEAMAIVLRHDAWTRPPLTILRH